jgi:hypothetical protein
VGALNTRSSSNHQKYVHRGVRYTCIESGIRELHILTEARTKIIRNYTRRVSPILFELFFFFFFFFCGGFSILFNLDYLYCVFCVCVCVCVCGRTDASRHLALFITDGYNIEKNTRQIIVTKYIHYSFVKTSASSLMISPLDGSAENCLRSSVYPLLNTG